MKTIIEKIADSWEDYSVSVAILIMLGSIALYFGVLCLRAWLIMLLWNWIAVGLFGAPILNFWLALGLNLLCSLLFKSKTTVNKTKN